MKILIKNIIPLSILILIGSLVFSSCDEDESTGDPVIHYVRVTDPDKSDSLLAGAYLGNLIAIMGENLGGAKKLWFNDKPAELIPTFITNTSILVTVPNAAPLDVTNQLVIQFGNGFVLVYDFVVAISDPVVAAMKNEYAPEGSVTVIDGDFFFEPLTVTFTGGVEAELVSVDQTQLEIIVPAGALSGPVTVETNFGITESTFHYQDQRNIFLNYDDLNCDGSWRPGLYVTDEHSIDGNYLKLSGTYSSDAPREEGPLGDNHYESQFWGNTRLPEGSLIPEGDVNNYVLKFEAKVIEWYASYLNICFAPWDNAGNQEIWANGFNPRAIWGPWDEENDIYDTGGEWITVVIPISDFIYDMGVENDNVVYTESGLKFNRDNAGSLSLWMLGAPESDNSPFEVYIDNVRIVEK